MNMTKSNYANARLEINKITGILLTTNSLYVRIYDGKFC